MARTPRQRIAFVVALALATLATAVAAWNFLWPEEDGWIAVGAVDSFPPGSVVSYGYGSQPLSYHVVRLDDGEFLALSARNPHRGNPVPYEPDLHLGYLGDGRHSPGWFREPLYHSTFDLAGVRVFGPTPRSLDRLALDIREGLVYVNPHEVMRAPRPPPGYKVQSGGVLLSPYWLQFR